ncbi:hypothetical protein NFI96_007532 [Prochilodus magdalenae]|nr:hypothetical protein NFI96_007532 [Prochilodus magdalenae]
MERDGAGEGAVSVVCSYTFITASPQLSLRSWFSISCLSPPSFCAGCVGLLSLLRSFLNSYTSFQTSQGRVDRHTSGEMGSGWTRSWKEEWKVENLYLVPSRPEVLLQPRWDVHPCVWLIYRCCMLANVVSWCVYTALIFNTPKFLIFLSHVSYILLGLYYLVALLNLAWALIHVRLFCQGRRWDATMVPADGAVGVEVEGHQVFWTCDDKPSILVLTTVPPHTGSLGVSTKTKAGLVTEDDTLPF